MEKLHQETFILRHLRLEKELNFYRLQNWTKIVRPRVKFLSPNWPLSPSWHFLQIFLCHWEFESLNCRYTYFYLLTKNMRANMKSVGTRGRHRWKFGRYPVSISTQKIFSGRYQSVHEKFFLAGKFQNLTICSTNALQAVDFQSRNECQNLSCL